MAETKEHQKQREKHHKTIGGVTHGVHHGIMHGEHTVMHSRNVHSNGKVKPNPHKGGAHGWIYTVGKTNNNVTTLGYKFWPGSNTRGGKGNPNIFSYANNRQLLKGKVDKYGNIKPGTKIIA